MIKLLRVAPGLVLNLSKIREISERDCGLYVTFDIGTVKFYPDLAMEDVWDKLSPETDYISNEKGLVIL